MTSRSLKSDIWSSSMLLILGGLLISIIAGREEGHFLVMVVWIVGIGFKLQLSVVLSPLIMTSSLKCFSHRTAVDVAVQLGLFTNRVHLLRNSGFFTGKWKVATFSPLADTSVRHSVVHPWETHLLCMFLGVEHFVIENRIPEFSPLQS